MRISLLCLCSVQVEQFQCVVPHTKLLLQLASVLSNHMSKEPNHKVRDSAAGRAVLRWFAMVSLKGYPPLHQQRSQWWQGVRQVVWQGRWQSKVSLALGSVTSQPAPSLKESVTRWESPHSISHDLQLI